MRNKLNIDEAKLEKTIKVKVNPKELRSKLIIPKVEYYIGAEARADMVFSGMVIPIPKVLIYYLNNAELMVASLIMEESSETGYCYFTNPEMSVRLSISVPSIGTALYNLRKMGLITERPNGRKGAGKARKLNYESIQYLNDQIVGENPGVLVRLRKRFGRRNVFNITKADVKDAYNNKLLDPDHDPEEEEEYD